MRTSRAQELVLLAPLLTLTPLVGCEPVTATVVPTSDYESDPEPTDVDLRVALVIDDEARAYDLTLDGRAELVASQSVVAPKSPVAISPDGTWWTFCDRPRPYGEATLWGGPLGEAKALGLPPDCHHPSPDVNQQITWAQFGSGSTLRRHDLQGRPLEGDDTREPRTTLWHPRVDPSGRWATYVASTGSDVGPVVVLDTVTGETWRTEHNSRGGWRDVNAATLAAATGDGILVVGLDQRFSDHWPVFRHFGDACDSLPSDWPCDVRPRDVGLSADGRVAVTLAPIPGSDRWQGWPLAVVDGGQEARVIASDGGRYGYPLWGASGEWIYALRDSTQVVRVPVDGGEVEVILEGDLTGWGGWSGTRAGDPSG